MEDAQGQFAEWPDQRLTYSYGQRADLGTRGGKKLERDDSWRLLEVRGRMVEPHEVRLDFDPRTGLLSLREPDKEILASVDVAEAVEGRDELFDNALAASTEQLMITANQKGRRY